MSRISVWVNDINNDINYVSNNSINTCSYLKQCSAESRPVSKFAHSTGRKRRGGPEGVTVSYRTQNAQRYNRHFCELCDLSSKVDVDAPSRNYAS